MSSEKPEVETPALEKTVLEGLPEHRKRPSVKNNGFAAMPAAKQAEIASKGGKAAHAAGTAHRFTPGPDGTAAAAAAKARGGSIASRQKIIGAEVGPVGKPDAPDGVR